MSVNSVGSNDTSSIGGLLLQQLAASSASSKDGNGLSGVLGDLLTLSPAAQQLSKAPEAITQAMSDLFSGKKDVSGDIAQLQSYFKQNPQSLTNVLSTLQGNTSTYSASGSTRASNAMVEALMKGKDYGSNTGAILNALLGIQNQNPLLSNAENSSSSTSNGNYLSLLS